jgi:hypothetical protein
MKTVRKVLLIFALVGSFGPPVFFLAVRQFHWEDGTAQWLVSIMPRSVALEDRRAAADMAVTYGELAAADMIIYSAIGWGIFTVVRIFKRGAKKKDSLPSLDDSLHSG